MKSKWIACLMAAMLIVTAPAAAKNKGTQTILDNWGSVTVPQNIYMEAGTQPTLAAQEADPADEETGDGGDERQAQEP